MNTKTMEYVTREYRVKGRPNEKTKEKIRIKIRFLLNKHSKASIFVSNFSDSKLNFQLENDGYKHASVVYQSSSLKSARNYENVFNELYVNEVSPVEENQYLDENNKSRTPDYKLIVAFRKLRKSY